jgi:hypothetical protein
MDLCRTLDVGLKTFDRISCTVVREIAKNMYVFALRMDETIFTFFDNNLKNP